MGRSKKPWEDIPIEIIIEEEDKRRRREIEIERQRPRIELPVHPPSTASYERPSEQNVEESPITTFRF